MQNLDSLDNISYKKVEVKIDMLSESYLDRVATVFEENTGETANIKLIKGRSTPQGSSQSPKFWRIHDKIYATIHQKKMDEILIKNDQIVCYEHFSFADDQVTVIGLKVERLLLKGKNDVDTIIENSKKINEAVALCRDSLSVATNTCGSQIHPGKTEIVVQPEYKKLIYQAKDGFKWLGYTFEINKNSKLVCDEKQLNSRKTTALKLQNDLYSYIKDYRTRYFIFRTWVEPIIDFFILKALADKNEENSFENSNLEKFQHQALATIAGSGPKGTKKEDLRALFGTLSIEQKINRFCNKTATFKIVATEIVANLVKCDYSLKKTRFGNHKVFSSKDSPKNNIYLKINQYKSDYPPIKPKINYPNLAASIKLLHQIRDARLMIYNEEIPEWEWSDEDNTDLKKFYDLFNNYVRPDMTKAPTEQPDR